MFSKACVYGIRASIFIASQSLKQNRVGLISIAENIQTPEAFTAKILQQLVKHGIVDSVKGPAGGFQIEKKRINDIKISEIVDSLEGNDIYLACGLGLKNCNSSKPCPLHDKFAAIRNNLKYMLESTSLYELAMGVDIESTFLKR
ncbi:Rrf2 family transcriptional regulator [Reichenbachiella sp. MALMAid0571]|uniref:RrF2 family transcriptional regulator n=1 Tax=Reichenbachiella sp. MALMAid0571 TaxID=3143939 RepID=UPI0032DFDD92